ncbi:MAG: hypothetical protein ABSC56_04390 [Solirubrobacteraceae bacterium]|jgi:hypothetical protein
MRIPLIGVRLGLPAIIYLVIGAFVAQGHNYFKHTGTLDGVLTAAISIVLWPFLLFGIHFHVT